MDSSAAGPVLFGAAAAAAVLCHAKRHDPHTPGVRAAARQARRLGRLASRWRQELWHSVVPFWLSHGVDASRGGFFTCLDRHGEVLDDTKFHWLQGRAVWTCSRLCRRLLDDASAAAAAAGRGADAAATTARADAAAHADVSAGEAERLLRAAHNGATFLKFAKEGSFVALLSGVGGPDADDGNPVYFSTTRAGWPTHVQRKPYTAVFYCMGCLEYSQLLRQHGAAAAQSFECQASDVAAAQAYFKQEALRAFDYVRECIEDPTLCGRLPSRHAASLSSPRHGGGVGGGNAVVGGGAVGPGVGRTRSGSVAIDLDTGETVELNASAGSASDLGLGGVGDGDSGGGGGGEDVKMSSLAEVMCLSALSEEMLAAVPEQRERWDGYVDDSMRRVLKHYCPRFRVFMEQAHPELGVQHNSPAARMFNPGHSIEVAWFLLHLCRLKDAREGPGASEEHRTVALSVLEHSLEIGWDTANGGGITYMMDILGRPLQDCTVTAEHKLWWPLCEALYALTLAFTSTGDEKWLAWLERVHDYIMTRLSDYADLRQHPRSPPADTAGKGGAGGEWFGYLRPDGSVFNECKGGNYKGFFHVPRALLFSIDAAEAFLSGKKAGGTQEED